MKRIILLAAAAALALSACTSPERFGPGSGAGAGGPGGTAGITGDPLDPTSPAYFAQTIGDRVFFAVDQSTLSDAAQATLAEQAAWLARNPEYDAVVEGHADEQGTREYNLALGARRASAVQTFLISRGVAPSRLRTVTYGKERPVAICSTEECYQRNRRAVTVVAAAGLS